MTHAPNPLCLITGASAGIGAAFAGAFAARGWDLALTARRADRLRALQDELESEHGVEVFVFPADLHDPAAPQEILDGLGEIGRSVDGLVNNAGYGLRGTFETTTWEEQARFLQIMLHAPTELAHKTIGGMRARGFGRIINIASLAGLLPATAGHTLYGPVKSYLIKMSEALHAEAHEDGVHVTALCPGMTYSEFHDVNGMRAKVSQTVPKFMWQDADAVVAAGMEAVERGAPVRVSGTPNKIMATLSAALPDPLARAWAGAQTKRVRDAS